MREKKLLKSVNRNSKEYWKAINIKVLGKSINEDLKLNQNGREISDGFEMANKFSEFFKKKVEDLEKSSDCLNFDITDLNSLITDKIYFNTQEVNEAITCLKSPKAMGLDEVLGVVIKHILNSISKPLCWVFNNTMDTDITPKAWKLSKIIPIHKKGEKDNVTNYRPVSNISSLSKLFERCVINK